MSGTAARETRVKKLLAIALPAGLAIAAAVLVMNAFRSRSEAAEAALERARLKRDFVERAALAQGVPAEPPGPWQDEVQALTRWYFDELTAIRNRHPGEPPRQSGAAAEEDRKLSAKDRATLAEFQKYADDRFALLREGRYAAPWSASGGGLRLDVLDVKPGPNPDGGAPALRIDFALWGAPRYLERVREGGKTSIRSVVPVAFRRLAFRFLDAKGKLYGEMSGGGEPYLRVDFERFVDDFPPGVLFGTWWVDLFPREASTVELELELAARGASGADRPVVLGVKAPVPDEWKLPPGAAFQAEERQAPAN